MAQGHRDHDLYLTKGDSSYAQLSEKSRWRNNGDVVLPQLRSDDGARGA